MSAILSFSTNDRISSNASYSLAEIKSMTKYATLSWSEINTYHTTCAVDCIIIVGCITTKLITCTVDTMFSNVQRLVCSVYRKAESFQSDVQISNTSTPITIKVTTQAWNGMVN